MPEGQEIHQEAHGSYIAQAASGGTATIQVYSTPPRPVDQNRRRFLTRLRTRYRDLLAQSFYGVIRLNLELAEHSQAVTPPVRLLYQADRQGARSLPAGTSLMQVYSEAGQELLILGVPGSGKSTLLLELAADLTDLAEKDESLLVPVIIPLSSWGNRRLPLEHWIPEQVALLYDLPRHLAEQWMREERLLPLLDGLDEMAEEQRPDCLAAINAYHRAHLNPLVVASRQVEYEAAAKHSRLTLHNAVLVQPLNDEQIDALLNLAGKPAMALLALMESNPALRDITTTPLLLSILLLTNQEKTTSELRDLVDEDEQKRLIFANYVESMIARKRTLTYSSPNQMIKGLQWLAWQMRDRYQTIFYLEHLQPDWLPPVARRAYHWWAIRMPTILLGIMLHLAIGLFLLGSNGSLQLMLENLMLGGLIGWLLTQQATRGDSSSEPAKKRRWQRLRRAGHGLLPGLLVGLGFAFCFAASSSINPGIACVAGIPMVICALLLSSLDLAPRAGSISVFDLLETQISFPMRVYQIIHIRRIWPIIVITGVCSGLSFMLTPFLLFGWSSQSLLIGATNGLAIALLFGLSVGMSSVLLNLLQGVYTRGIVLTERLRWTWRSFWKGLFAPGQLGKTVLIGSGLGLLLGMGDSLLLLLSSGYYGEDIGMVLLASIVPGVSVTLTAALSIGLLYWMFTGLMRGVLPEQVKDEKRRKPNQGIRRSLSNSLLLGAISGIMLSLVSLLGVLLNSIVMAVLLLIVGHFDLMNSGATGGLDILNSEFASVPIYGVGIALVGALFIGALRGGLAVLGHFVIRWQLVQTRQLPWRLQRFLEEATARILLRRVGGGYSFPHRLLLDYLADLETPTGD